MPNLSKPTKNISKFDIRLFMMALILAAVGLVIFAVVGVFVNFKSKELRTQWLSRSPMGQVVNVIPAGGSGWGSSATLIQTNLGYFSVRGGIALRYAEALNLVELGDHSRLLCDAENHCMAVDERLELAPKEKVQ